GSECTGKTTLAERLALRYETVWVREYGRQYVDALARPPAAEDIDPIGRGQIAAEDEAARRANRVLVLDTDLLSTLVYGRHYFGEVPSWLEPAVRARVPDLYLLCGIDVPWVADGVQRDRGHRRDEVQGLFRDAIRAQQSPFIELDGTVDERLEQAVRAIDLLLVPSP
ncbi:MAG: ATP-binding protein, partial [Thermoanaerobaculia bacterium]